MRRIRSIAVIASAGFVLAASTTAWGAATTGVGTGTLSVTALSVQLGNNGALLSARVVGVDSQSTTDGTALARTVLAPASLSSASLPALNVSAPPVEVQAPGAQTSRSTPAVPLSTPVSTGSVDPATLSAAVDASGAHSTIAASVSNLSIAGGLLSEPSVKVGIDTSSASAAAASNQNVTLGPIAVLDIGALLKGLGLDLSKLPLDVVSQLLGDLGAKLQGLGATSLATAVTGVETTITGLKTQLGVTAADLPPVTVPTIPPLPVDTTPLTSLLPGLGIPQLPSSPTPADITNVINQLNATLASLLTQALQTLATTPVLSVSGVQVGLASKAADTLADSAASITANLGTVKVGTLASVDLTSLLNQATSAVQGLVAQLNTAVSTLLGTVNAQLAHLVTVSVLDQTKSVSESGGYTNAVAGVTALTAKITPPANVAGLFKAQATTPSVGNLITQAGGAVPALAGAMSTLNSTLSAPALAAGGVVKLGTLSVSSRHTPAAAPAPGTTGGGTPTKGAPGSPLPATGTDQAPLAVLGIAFAAIAIALLRWLHRPSPTH